MDSQRLILFFVFSFSLFLLYDAWQRDQQPAPPAATKSREPQSEKRESPTPVITGERLAPAQPAKPPEGRAADGSGETIKVETDVVRAEISTVGGELQRLEFKRHADAADKSKPFVLFQRHPEHVYVAQSGLIGEYVAESGQAEKLELPTHYTLYKAASLQYQLAAGSDAVEVRLEAAAPLASTTDSGMSFGSRNGPTA